MKIDLKTLKIISKIVVLMLCLTFWSCKKETKKKELNTTEIFHSESEKGEYASNLDFVFEQISDLQKDNKIVGAEVLIVRNDTILLHDAVGWSDKEKQRKLEKNSIYRIRSMTKPIVATAILILLEEGKISLEDRVSKFIPAFDHPNAKDITIQQLLSHTSGLASHDFEEIGLSKPPHEFETLSEVVDEIGLIGIIKEPGKWHYSGSGIATLTELISILSGTSTEDFIKNRIFTPLDMSTSYTSFEPSVNWASNLNPTYEWIDSINDFRQYWNPNLEPEYKYFRGHGGVYTTAMDYAKFLSMWLHKGKYKNIQILSEETINFAHSTTVELALKGPLSHQSLAWKMLKSDSISNRIDYYFHGGSDGTVAMVYPEENTLALYFNQSRNHRRNIFENLMTITQPFDAYRKWNYNNEFLDQWKEILLRNETTGSDFSIGQIDSYAGTYKCQTNNDFDSEIIVRNNQLILKNLKSGYECRLLYNQNNQFLCWFKPPPYGFLSKAVFKKSEENIQSFSLEWLNKTTFEFEKIK